MLYGTLYGAVWNVAPEIRANPLRSVLYIGGGGVPCMYIVTFYCSPAEKIVRTPPLFWAGDATVYGAVWNVAVWSM